MSEHGSSTAFPVVHVCPLGDSKLSVKFAIAGAGGARQQQVGEVLEQAVGAATRMVQEQVDMEEEERLQGQERTEEAEQPT